MCRAGVCVAALALAGGIVRADIAPPPGHTRVPVDHLIEFDRAYPEYVFFVLIGGDAQWSYRCEVGPGSQVRIGGAGRSGRARMCWLSAVPKAAAGGYDTDADLLRAVLEHKVPGVLQSSTSFDAFVVLKERGAPSGTEEHHRVERVTSAEGIVISTARREGHRPAEREGSLVRWAVVGAAVAGAGGGLGLWLWTRRRGPKPSP